jgi:23S rRNA (pseudouridine1915-N3)-methyltransferase
MIRVIAVGKKHESWIAEGLQRYEKRLRAPFDVQWTPLSYSDLETESQAILAKIKPDEYIILLDERGCNLSSVELSDKLSTTFTNKNVTVIIGGAYGVNEAVQKRADLIWSLSNLVFPHMLVRLILIEQIYRAQEIYHNRPYHHK